MSRCCQDFRIFRKKITMKREASESKEEQNKDNIIINNKRRTVSKLSAITIEIFPAWKHFHLHKQSNHHLGNLNTNTNSSSAITSSTAIANTFIVTRPHTSAFDQKIFAKSQHFSDILGGNKQHRLMSQCLLLCFSTLERSKCTRSAIRAYMCVRIRSSPSPDIQQQYIIVERTE